MLKFRQASDHLDNCIGCRLISENGRIEIGVYPVIFGMRVRAGYVGDTGCNLDYCAGNDQRFLEQLYFCVRTILEKYDGDFSVFPDQEIKPCNLDPNCWPMLLDLAGGYPDNPPQLDPISEVRSRLLNGFFVNGNTI